MNTRLEAGRTPVDSTANYGCSEPTDSFLAPEVSADMLADSDVGRCCDGPRVGRRCQVELETLDEDFVITPALARMLVTLVRRRLDRVRARTEAGTPETGRAA